MPVNFTAQPSSYRDPSGFLFYRDGILYRQVNKVFAEDFDQFMSGGLYQSLTEKKLLVTHRDVDENLTGTSNWHRTIQPETIPFISYPYEWCFDMWKDAALTTLEAAREAMSKGMMLKDATAYNIQWHRGHMMFLDTLSFERYNPQQPWIAYRQFCEQFLAPLALMHYLQWPLSSLFLTYPEGLPLPLVKKLLPFRTRFNLHIFLHLHLQGTMSTKASTTQKASSFSEKKLADLLRSLQTAVNSFSLNSRSGVWSDYYEEAGQRDDYLEQKEAIVERWTRDLPVQYAIDLGANEGRFSRLLAAQQKYVVSADFDHYSVNRLYLEIKKQNISNIHPVVLDLAHPSPAIGVNLEERASFIDRVPKGLVLALALVHHLAIGKNIPFGHIVRLVRSFGPWLLIEFIPKEDEKIATMLRDKKDIYEDYTQEAFLAAFSKEYNIVAQEEVSNSKRILYLMQAHAS
jgi:hypothetical protein